MGQASEEEGSWHDRSSLGDGRPSEAPSVARRVRRTTARPTRPRGMRSRTATPMVLVTALSLLVVAPVLGAGPRRTIEVTWQPVTVDDGGRGSIRAITRGGPGFVAVGRRAPETTAAIWTSADANTWQRAQVDEATDAAVSDVTRYGDGLVAVGTATEGKAFSPAVWNSTDGLKWSRVPLDPSFKNGRMNAVAATGTRLVAVGCAAPATRRLRVLRRTPGRSVGNGRRSHVDACRRRRRGERLDERRECRRCGVRVGGR